MKYPQTIIFPTSKYFSKLLQEIFNFIKINLQNESYWLPYKNLKLISNKFQNLEDQLPTLWWPILQRNFSNKSG